MIVLQGKNLEKSYNGEPIFSNVSFSLKKNQKIGLVGKNGAGKSTLFKLLTSSLELDSGEITIQKEISLGYLEQIISNQDKNLFQFLLESFNDIIALREEILHLENEISQNSDNKTIYHLLLEKYVDKTTLYENKNGYAIESQITGIVIGLGFDKSDLSRPLDSFSGGEKSRLALARLLIRKPDILILDEPTNHLDISSVEWLEAHLKNYTGTLFLISHDRKFLNAIVEGIYELENKTINFYQGNYSDYIDKKTEQLRSYQKALEKQQKEIEKTEAFILKYKAGVKSKQARGRQKQLNRLERLENLSTNNHLTLLESQPSQSGNLVLKVENISKSFDHKEIFKNISFDIFKGEKIGLIGKNGSGKSTLIKSILKIENTDFGSIQVGSRVIIGYFDQKHNNLNLEYSIYQTILNEYDMTKQEIRKVLAQFLFFENDLEKKVKDLSGGEKTRLSLLLILLSKPNFLILDEPTNHLDLESQSIIETFLSQYTGTLFIVSHDRYFLDSIVEKIFVLENKTLTIFYGNYSYYKSKIEEQAFLSKNDEEVISSKPVKKIGSKSKSKLKLALENCENSIFNYEMELEDLKETISKLSPDDYESFVEYAQKIESLEANLQKLYENWSQLSNELEELQ